MRKLVKLPSFSQFNAGATSTLNLPLNITYDAILLKYRTGVPADIERLEVKVNGNTIQEFVDGAADVDQLNTYYNRQQTSGETVLWFARPEMKTLAEQRVTSLGLMSTNETPITSATINIDLRSAGLTAGFDVEAWAIQSEPKPIGVITKIKNHQINMGAGESDHQLITGNALMMAIHMKKPTADITHVRLKADTVDLYDYITTADLKAIQDLYLRKDICC